MLLVLHCAKNNKFNPPAPPQYQLVIILHNIFRRYVFHKWQLHVYLICQCIVRITPAIPASPHGLPKPCIGCITLVMFEWVPTKISNLRINTGLHGYGYVRDCWLETDLIECSKLLKVYDFFFILTIFGNCEN